MFRKLIILITFVLSMTSYAWSAPKYVIFMIGDGMGHEQVAAAGMYKYGYEYGTDKVLSFESLRFQGEVKTFSANYGTTDSAAGGTAMATGTKVNNGVISTANPDNDEDLQTILEYYSQQGKSTGLVTNKKMIDATPAAFGSHVSDRSNYSLIVKDYANVTQPNVLFGAGASHIYNSQAFKDLYDVVTDWDGLNNYVNNLDNGTIPMISGLFGTGSFPFESDFDYENYPRPHLSEMTWASLEILDNDEGFFLMVESGLIDAGGHEHKIKKVIHETLQFSETVQLVTEWIEDENNGSSWDNTLLIVTADHETGGLWMDQSYAKDEYPDDQEIWWSDLNPDASEKRYLHTNANVPVYAQGVNADLVEGELNNTDLYYIAKGETPPASLAHTSTFTDLASWEAEVSDIEKFITSRDNIPLADEVSSLSGVNDKIGSMLTFQSASTSLSRSFTVESLQAIGEENLSAGFTFNDIEGTELEPPSNYTDALSVGDRDGYENDDWRVSVKGDSITAFGFEIKGSKFAPYESITLYSNDVPIDTIDLSYLSEMEHGNYFIGITSDVPFDTIEFDEDNDEYGRGDDIAIADFYFATVNASSCTDNDNDGFSIEGGSCGNLDCDDDNPSVHPAAVETCNGIDDNCDHLIDNGLHAVFNDNQKGVCAGSLKICNGIDGWENDYSQIDYFEQDELTCSDGTDNDCDGEIDESDNCSYVELNLTVGWNMISLPLAPSDMRIDKVLSSIAGKYKDVWTYDGTWKIYDPDSPLSDLETMEAGRGYWIYMQEEAILTVTGSEPSNSVILKSGWNLVGYNSLMSETVTEALSSIDGKYISVWVYKDGSWLKFYSNNSSLSDLTIMEPGYGYWINMTEDATLTLQ